MLACGSGVPPRPAIAKGKGVRKTRGYHMLRKGRRSLAKHFYLITTQTHHRSPILADTHTAQIILSSLNWLNQHNLLTLDTAVIMPDHVHIVGQLHNQPLESVMHKFKSYTSKQIGLFLERDGQIWQRGYHDHAIRKDESLNQIRLYVLNNPVRAKIVDDFHNYPYWYSRWNL